MVESINDRRGGAARTARSDVALLVACGVTVRTPSARLLLDAGSRKQEREEEENRDLGYLMDICF